MKYIKTYESLKLKKYIICKGEHIDYLVLETLDKISNFIINVVILTFSKRIDEIKKSGELKTSIKAIKNRIIFQSDDINEIREELELLKNIKKFNI